MPSELVERPKSGFGVPFESWSRGPLRDWAADRLFDPRAYEFIDPVPVRRAWDAHQSGRANTAYELWDVIMFSVWASEHGAN